LIALGACAFQQRSAAWSFFIGGRDEKILNHIKTFHEIPADLSDDSLSVSSCDGLRRRARLSPFLPSIFNEILRKISNRLNPYR
jgi:hypothetical protein